MAFTHYYMQNTASLVAQLAKNLPAVQETWIRSLGREYLLAKEMAKHSSILAWKIPWTEDPGELQSMESQSWTRLNVCVHLVEQGSSKSILNVLSSFSQALVFFPLGQTYLL